MEVHLIRSFAHYRRAAGPPNLSKFAFSQRALTIISKPMQAVKPLLGAIVNQTIEQNLYQCHGLNVTSTMFSNTQEMLMTRVMLSRKSGDWQLLWQTCQGKRILATVELRIDCTLRFILHDNTVENPVYPNQQERTMMLAQLKTLLDKCLPYVQKNLDDLHAMMFTTTALRDIAMIDLPDTDGLPHNRLYISKNYLGTRLIGAVWDGNPRFLSQLQTHRVGSMWIPFQELLISLRSLAKDIFELPGMSKPVCDPEFVGLFPRVAAKFFQLKYLVQVLFTMDLELKWREEIACFMARPYSRKRNHRKKKNRGLQILQTCFLFFTQLAATMQEVDELDPLAYGIYDSLAHIARCAWSDNFVNRMKGHLARVITSFTQFNFTARSREVLEKCKSYSITNPAINEPRNWEIPDLRTLVCSKSKNLLAQQLWLNKNNRISFHPQPFSSTDCLLGGYQVRIPFRLGREDIIHISRIGDPQSFIEIPYTRSTEIQGWSRLEIASWNKQRLSDKHPVYFTEGDQYSGTQSRISKLSLLPPPTTLPSPPSPPTTFASPASPPPAPSPPSSSASLPSAPSTRLDQHVGFGSTRLTPSMPLTQSTYGHTLLRVCRSAADGHHHGPVTQVHKLRRTAGVGEDVLVGCLCLTDVLFVPSVGREWRDGPQIGLQVGGVVHNAADVMLLIKDQTFPPFFHLLSFGHAQMQASPVAGVSSKFKEFWGFSNQHVVFRGKSGLLFGMVYVANSLGITLLELVVLHRSKHVPLVKEQRPLFKSPLPASFSAGQHVVQFDARHLRLLFWWSEKRWVPFREGEDRAGSPEDGRFEFFAHVKVAKFLF